MNIQNKDQWHHAFIEACQKSEIEDVRHLCQKKYLAKGWADVHAEDDYGFRWACHQGHCEVVRWLVLDYGIEKTMEIEKIIKYYPQAQEYFRAREERKEIQAALEKIKPKPSQSSEEKEDK